MALLGDEERFQIHDTFRRKNRSFAIYIHPVLVTREMAINFSALSMVFVPGIRMTQ